MSQIEILNEQIKIKKKVVHIKLFKTDDYRTFVEVEPVLEHEIWAR